MTEYQYNMLGDLAETDLPDAATGLADSGGATEGLLQRRPAVGGKRHALGNKSTFGYGWLGDQVTSSLPNPSTGAAGGPTTTSVFDLDSEKVESTTQSGGM